MIARVDATLPETLWRWKRIGQPELTEDPRSKTAKLRAQHRDDLTDALDGAFRQHPTAYWLEALNGVLPISPVLTVKQAFENPFLQEIDMVRPVPHPEDADMKLLGNPLKFNRARLSQQPCRPLEA